MPTSKYLIIDGVEHPCAIMEMKRTGDVLDLEATRTADGVLHREVIGTFYNYSLTIAFPNSIKNGDELYEQLWWVLTAPVASHQVQLPYQPEPFEGYFSSCTDGIVDIKRTNANNKSYGADYHGKGITCTLTATRPSRVAGEENT